ncbi:MAG: N-acetylmuramoyl-L-alanine amidase [Rhodospirillaceae bacterium]|jgi:N-acetylmuramoyl-L-alanine amidase|nr:N-acetylmuramoyl-L-alanine amidase [Rhodospirillaceae bacterium]MBT5459661.1 N-acetylmuramoyl-L-alanine amidase [Rhodospirillaceae bacterium]
MYWIRRSSSAIFAGFVLFAGAAADLSARPVVESVRVGDQIKKTRFVVDLSAKVSFSVFTLADPYRVVIDLSEVDWRLKPDAVRPGRRITGFRFGLFRSGQSRMVLDVKQPVNVTKAFILGPSGHRGHRLVIDLAETSRPAFLAALRRSKPASSRIKRKSPAVRPSPPPKARDTRPLIAIDPGHGGVDPGARGRGGSWEKTITLLQARELKRQLLRTGRYRVLLTRRRDVFVRLRERIAIAQRAQADLFISLHADSISNHRIRGGAVYTLSERASDKEAAALARKENKADIIAGIDLNEQSTTVAKILIDLRQRLTKNESVTLAKGLVSELGKSMRLLRNNHRFAGFAVLKAPDIPSVLIEMGYLSNRTDERLLRQAKHRGRVARSIVRATNVYFARQQALRQP